MSKAVRFYGPQSRITCDVEKREVPVVDEGERVFQSLVHVLGDIAVDEGAIRVEDEGEKPVEKKKRRCRYVEEHIL